MPDGDVGAPCVGLVPCASEFSVWIARTIDDCRAAARLVEARYAQRGFHVDRLFPPGFHSSRVTTLAAGCDGRLLGTLTLHLDSPGGLCADEAHRPIVDRVRAGGGRACELTRLAVEPGNISRQVLDSLFDLAYVVGRTVHEVTHAFIEVKPGHAAFYRKRFGFRVASDESVCPRVNAPAVLMLLELQTFGGRALELAPFPGAGIPA